jgi:hypothetical protein
VLQPHLQGEGPCEPDEWENADSEDIARISPHEREPLRPYQRTGRGNPELYIRGELADVAAGKPRAEKAAAHIGDNVDLNVCLSLSGAQIQGPIATLADASGQAEQS